jgi:hypothetical protein
MMSRCPRCRRVLLGVCLCATLFSGKDGNGDLPEQTVYNQAKIAFGATGPAGPTTVINQTIGASYPAAPVEPSGGGHQQGPGPIGPTGSNQSVLYTAAATRTGATGPAGPAAS